MANSNNKINNADKKRSQGQKQPKLIVRKARTTRSRIPSITTLRKNVKNIVVGQDVAVDRLILAIYRSIKIPELKSNIIVIGKSGIGKKETIRQIARLLKLPYVIVDATEYDNPYNQDKQPEDMIASLYGESECSVRKTEKGILVIDKIDEKIKDKKGLESNIVVKDTLESKLVKIIEGTTIPIIEPDEEEGQKVVFINTSKIIVILMGAFEGLETAKRVSKGKNIIGFKNQDIISKKNANYTKDDLMSYGMSAELVGQIDTIVKFEQLSENDLADIAKNSKMSIFKKYEKYFAKIGIVLEYDENIFEKMAKSVSSNRTGAFELSNVTNEAFEDVLLKVFTAREGKYKKCILKEDFIQNPKSYVLM